jgi:predicted transcriptional regulator of viral defense system
VTSSDVSNALSKIDVGTLATWRAAGLSKRQLYTLVDSGQLVRIRHGAFATRGVLDRAKAEPGLRHALDVAAVMAIRVHTGIASHHSAAQLHGLRLLKQPPDGTVTLTVPPGSRAGPYRQAVGVICHAAELPAEHVTRLYGMPVTTAARTVVDIARTDTFMEGVVVADSALYERWASKSELRRVLDGCERWPGASRAREVIEFADQLAESVLESCARVLFREQGLPPPELQVHISGPDRTVIARADFFWRRYGVIAETDGLLKYDSGDRAIAERRRDRLLQEAGFEVIHVTWQELFSDPARVAGRIRRAFGRAERLGVGRWGRRGAGGGSSSGRSGE